jgi:cysteine synthase B
VLTDPLEGTDGAILEARRRAAGDPDRYVYVDQYANPANVRAHECTTGPEIWEQTAGAVTHVVAGVGTSGTVLGLSRCLRPRGVRLIAVQPDQSLHGLDGLKHMATAIRPALWDEAAADEHATCSTEEAFELVRRLAREEGLLAGPSSGAALATALRVAARDEGLVVALLPDGGEHYLSTPLWE